MPSHPKSFSAPKLVQRKHGCIDMKHLAALALLTVACATTRPPAANAETKSVPRIGRITFRMEPVFSEQEASRGGFYRAADMLAIPIRESLLRKFLLFHEGQPFVESRLRESERNL